jgi:polyphosphate kinase
VGHLLRYRDLNEEQKRFADDYFHNTVFPVLTPLGFDPGRPFPHISNLSLSIGVVVKKPPGQEHFGRVKVPETLDQLLRLPGSVSGSESFVWLDALIEVHLQPLFAGMEIEASCPFHVTRDAEVCDSGG